ncbi:MAG TPA: 4-alpha-glucanotransferase [Candidatus Dormibacteraeota bacterium]
MTAGKRRDARPDPAAWGVARSYTDTGDTRHRPSRRSVAAALEAMGADSPAPTGAPAVILAPGQGASLAAPALCLLEEGGELALEGRVPPDLPVGVHSLIDRRGTPAPLIVAPVACHLPRGLRVGGLSVQLYAARSAASWGIGDLADLRVLAAWAAELGAGAVLVSPLHAALPTLPQQDSPYSPSSRRFRTLLALRIEEIDGFAADPELGALAARGTALNRARLIDRDAVFRLKLAALERLHAGFRADPAFTAYRAAQGGVLRRFAIHCALIEAYPGSWLSWPAELRHPSAGAVTAWARAHRERVALHEWIQWQIDRQLEAAAPSTRVVNDLAVGVDPDGADAWLDQDLMVPGIRLGAPPDAFATGGQAWELPVLNPWRLRAAGYAPFREAVRAALRHAGGIRIDHVLGLFRQWWIPPGADPAEGVYVRYPSRELLAILALESHRARALVVGEDLGTVARGVRGALARHRVLSSRVLWFEDRPPEHLPRRCLATLGTHDLPTVAGLWSSADLEAQRELGLEPDSSAQRRLRAHVEALGLDPEAALAGVCAALHARLARSPSAVVTASLDDLALAAERPNLPGSAGRRPNWRIGLPRPLEQLLDDPFARATAATVFRRSDAEHPRDGARSRARIGP